MVAHRALAAVAERRAYRIGRDLGEAGYSGQGGGDEPEAELGARTAQIRPQTWDADDMPRTLSGPCVTRL